MSRKKKLGLSASIVVLVFAAFVTSGEDEAVHVNLVDVQSHDVSPTVLATGAFVLSTEARLSPEIMGVVREVLVREGDHVDKGDVVLRFDRTSLLADVESQRAAIKQQTLRVELAEAEIGLIDARAARGAELEARQLIGRESYEQLVYQAHVARLNLDLRRQEVRQSEALLTLAMDQLQKAEIRAPIAGTVVALGITVGETAVPSASGIPGSELMSIADLEELYAELVVDESDITRVAVGSQVDLTPSAPEASPIQGIVRRVAEVPVETPSLAGTRRERKTYRVEVELLDDAHGVKPGMTCRAEVRTGSEVQELAVPVQAVVDSREGASPYVLVVSDNKAQRRKIELGAQNDTFVAVTRGLKLGESVAIAPPETLSMIGDGQDVRVGRVN